MSTFVFEVESDDWTEERVNSVIMAIDRLNGCTVVDEYPVSDDDVLLDAISRDTGMNITKEELDDALR